MRSLRKTKRSAEPNHQAEYQKLEHQRKNPHLYTTLSQCVNPDGSITTFDHVTHKLREALDKLQELHTTKYKGTHPAYCMRPIMGKNPDVLCEAIEMHQNDMDKVQATFVRNYAHASGHYSEGAKSSENKTLRTQAKATLPERGTEQ